ncbi:MAG: hypothetical protein QOF51_1478 [Chloroflexota bacterium]|nr:hypothetical protein [Chloroflexota bacterium]
MRPEIWQAAALLAFSATGPLLIALGSLAAGAGLALASLTAAWRWHRVALRRIGVLLGCLIVLALAPIDTNTSNPHVLELGIPFLAVLIGPAAILGRTDPGVIRYRLLPTRFGAGDAALLALSVPLAWASLHLYFALDPGVAFNWTLPPEPDDEALVRLFLGINAVGIWDELFFVNTSFAILRSLYPLGVSNLAQATVYTSVLYRMAFTGPGPFFVGVLALTQAALFERTESLLYVITIHVIVDYFLFQQIVGAHYPLFSAWWHPALHVIGG